MDTTTGVETASRDYFHGLDDILADLKFWLPRCDAEVTMRKVLAETAQQFCRDTGAFEYISTIAVVNDTVRYAIPLPWPADILVVKDVLVETTNNGLVSRSLMHPNSYWIEDTTDTDATYFNLPNALNVGTGTTAEIKIEMALIPYFDQMSGTQAYALPDKFIRRWRSAFVNGAVSRLAAMDNRPWTNKQLALDARAQYASLEGEAISKANIVRQRQGSASCANPTGWF